MFKNKISTIITLLLILSLPLTSCSKNKEETQKKDVTTEVLTSDSSSSNEGESTKEQPKEEQEIAADNSTVDNNQSKNNTNSQQVNNNQSSNVATQNTEQPTQPTPQNTEPNIPQQPEEPKQPETPAHFKEIDDLVSNSLPNTKFKIYLDHNEGEIPAGIIYYIENIDYSKEKDAYIRAYAVNDGMSMNDPFYGFLRDSSGTPINKFKGFLSINASANSPSTADCYIFITSKEDGKTYYQKISYKVTKNNSAQ